MADDGAGKCIYLVGRNHRPQFAGQGDIADINITARLFEHLLDKGLVHRRLATMGVKMACREFDRLSQHHAEGDILNAEFMGNLQRLANIVAIFHKRLLGQVRVERLDKAFTLAAAVNDYTL